MKTTQGRHCSIIARTKDDVPATRTRCPSLRAVPVTLDVKIRSRLSKMPVGPASAGTGTASMGEGFMGEFKFQTLDCKSMRRHGAKNADYRGGVTCLYETQLLGACLHASESGGR